MTVSALVEYLQGRKTNLSAAILFTAAVTAFFNGWTEADMAAFAVSVAAITAALRAGLNKPVVLSAVLAAVFTMTACAGFYEKGPQGEPSPADDLQVGIVEFSGALPPPWNFWVPAITGLVTIGGAAVVRSKPAGE